MRNDFRTRPRDKNSQCMNRYLARLHIRPENLCAIGGEGLRILVTGGAGYVGSHVVYDLVETGHDVMVIDNLSTGHLAAVPGSVHFVEGSLLSVDKVEEAFRSFQPEAVMHFAASTQVGESVHNPNLYFWNNVVGGINLLDTMVKHNVRKIVFSSTAAVYGEPVDVPIPEEHPTVPTNPYGESKLFFEKILSRYEQAYGIRFMILRYFNAAGAHPSAGIGEDHNPETHLIPIVLQVALGRRDLVTIFGDDYPTPDGTAIRDYVHVSDLAAAHLLALEALNQGAKSKIYNLGNGHGFSVLEVIREVESVVGKRIPSVVGQRRPGDPAVLVASSEKARHELGWKPRYSSLADIIRTAWEWHRANPNGYKKEEE